MLFFGDSITYGAWDLEGGWVQRLRKLLDEKQIKNTEEYYYMVYNLGIDGGDSTKLLEHFEDETRRRLWPGEETIIIFSTGANDALIEIDKGKNRTSINIFKKNIEKLIEKADKFTKKVIFVGTVPHEESKTNPVSWDENISYKNKDLKKYNETIKDVCSKKKVSFIDVFNKLNNKDFIKTLDDGVHPNSEGHKIMFEIIKDYLIKNKIL